MLLFLQYATIRILAYQGKAFEVIDKQAVIDTIGGKLAVFGDNVGLFKFFTTILQ